MKTKRLSPPQRRVMEFLSKPRRGCQVSRLWRFGDLGWTAVRGARFQFRVRASTVDALERLGLIVEAPGYRIRVDMRKRGAK